MTTRGRLRTEMDVFTLYHVQMSRRKGRCFSLLTNNLEASTEPLPDCHHKSPAVWLGDLSNGEFVAQFLT